MTSRMTTRFGSTAVCGSRALVPHADVPLVVILEHLIVVDWESGFSSDRIQ